VRDIFTGLYCFKNDWDSSNTRVKKTDKEADALNQNLDLIRHKATHAFDELKFSGDSFTIDELVDKIKSYQSFGNWHYPGYQ
jgi:hypothetical protein